MKFSDLPQLNAIDGLSWIPRWRMTNDPTGAVESYVIPFPQMRSFNVVFHGDKHFDYGHYGIHLGQEDRLTFLGDPRRRIQASFYDARIGSPTRGVRFTAELPAGSSHTLQIPPGVAHKFSGLEGIVTINSYRIFLPAPDRWESQLKLWNPKADVINVVDADIDREAPAFEANTEPASEEYYRLFAERRAVTQAPEQRFPEMFQLSTREGKRWVRVHERYRAPQAENRAEIPIEGCAWKTRLFVSTGEESGIVPFTEDRPFYIVDHGFTHYANDTFGIHLGQEDRLTFLGPTDHRFQIELVDARKHSPTRGQRHAMEVSPSAIHELVIPQGVAHRFLGIEKVFTLNCPRYRIHSATYRPGLDTLDWNSLREPLPELVPHPIEVSRDFYLRQVERQAKLVKSPMEIFSPTGYLTQDRHGQKVKLVFRKKAGIVANAR